MPRMIDLIKNSAVPAALMRTASRGALALPGEEMVEILVYLSSHAIFGEQAKMTLASWDEPTCLRVCADPTTPFEVIGYFLDPRNRRPKLIPALLENPSVPELDLQELAQEHSTELIAQLLASPRVLGSRNILHSLLSNPALTPPQHARVNQVLQAMGETISAETGDAAGDPETEADLQKFLAEHAHEIAAEEGKAFQLVGEEEELAKEAAASAQATAAKAAADKLSADKVTADAAAAQKEADDKAALARMSPLQKISKLSVGERIQLAMKGNKEDRFILIRDGAKLVSSAVLASAKVTDQEVEMFAGMKNVQESVLRGIAGKRKFMKQYSVVRALVNNPRCPLDVQMNLCKNLLNQDLKALSMNKNISETVRKLGLKMFKERTEKKSPFG
jgi:hypothetical protein